MEKKPGQSPAFPCEHELNFNANGYAAEAQDGMSKRLYIATMAMQGILSNSEITVKNAKDYAEMAFDFADELLKQEHNAE